MEIQKETEFTRKRRERAEAIISDYRKLTQSAPGCTIEAYCRTLSTKYDVTPRAIRNLLLRHGTLERAYTRKPLKPKRYAQL